MKKILEGFYAFFLILAVGFWCQAADTVVAEWDFSVNTTGTTDGRIADGFTRGETVISDGWLTMPAGTGVTVPQGFQVSKAVHPELAPQSGFRVEAVAKLADDEPDKNLLTILDTKYLLDVGPKSREQAFHGFLFGLVKASNGKSARLRISLGFQADSVQVDSDFFNVGHWLFAFDIHNADCLDELDARPDVGVDGAPEVTDEGGRLMAVELHHVELEVHDAGHDVLRHLVDKHADALGLEVTNY